MCTNPALHKKYKGNKPLQTPQVQEGHESDPPKCSDLGSLEEHVGLMEDVKGTASHAEALEEFMHGLEGDAFIH